jgi:hypothetical protein
MTESEMLNQLLKIFPNATLGADNDGQLIIFTDTRLSRENIVPFEEN